MSGDSGCVGCLDRDGPGATVLPMTSGPHFAVDGAKRRAMPQFPCGFGQAVNAVALGDAGQVQRKGS